MRESPIHASLNRQKLIMGVGDKAFVFEVALFTIMLNLQAWVVLWAIVPLHLLFRWMYTKDPIALNAYLKYMREADVYDPWVRSSVSQERPRGFGRGLNC